MATASPAGQPDDVVQPSTPEVKRSMSWRRSKRTPPSSSVISAIVARHVRLADRLDPSETTRLQELVAELITTKRWEAIDGIDLSDEVLVTVAANAAIAMLHLDLTYYRLVRAILIRPSSATSHAPHAGPIPGSYSDAAIATIGEAAAHAGPVAISWDAAFAESRRPQAGRNVVIHEFAHKIDAFDGDTDGIPPAHGPALAQWAALMGAEFANRTSPPHGAALRDYAWTNPAEFFAVATESFFCVPIALRHQRPALYGALASFFDQDPANRLD